ncbi:MAG: polysaccharide deacetylase family protein [Candidatus Zixiibacteriota bacterium]
MKRLIKNILISVAAALGMAALGRWLNRRRLAILMYHGLIDDDRPSEWTQLAVNEFEEQIRHLARHYTPVTLEQAVDYVSGNCDPGRNPVVVTFDDGYRSNYELGLPILQKYNVPATVFITTSLLGDSVQPPRTLWFDRVYGVASSLPAGEIDLTSLGLARYRVSGAEDRIAMVEVICEHLKGFASDERSRTIDKLSAMFPATGPTGRRYVGADWDHVRQHQASITPAAHTVNHEILSRLPEDQARQEILQSKQAIEHETDSQVTFFAYPNGRREDFTDETKRLVAEAGFRAALTTIEGLNEVGDDLFELKRLGIGSNATPKWFHLKVAGVLDFWSNKGAK